MRNVLKNFASDIKGVTLIEYGLIAALIAVALVGVLTTLSGNLSGTFTSVGSAV